MTDHDRGAYTPQTDAPLAFDARRAGGGAGGPAPLTLIVSGVVLLLLVIALLLFYRSGVRNGGGPPQVVGAPVGQTRSAPAESAAPSAGPTLQIFKSEVPPPSEGRAPTFTPAPEAPASRPAPKVAASDGAPSSAPPATAAPAKAAGPTSAPLRPAVTEATPARPLTTEPEGTAPITTAPAPAKPVAAKPVKPAPASAAAAAPVAGEHLVQIGAFSSNALAEKGWNDTAAVLPGRMAGRTAKVEAASRDGKTFYRSFVGGFATKAEAQSFCDALKAAGKSCLVR